MSFTRALSVPISAMLPDTILEFVDGSVNGNGAPLIDTRAYVVTVGDGAVILLQPMPVTAAIIAVNPTRNFIV